MNLNEVKEELQHSLNEWGLQERHFNFRQTVLRCGVEMASDVGSDVNYQDAKKDTFPLNISDAYEKVLKSDIESFTYSNLYLCHDKLDVGGFGEPFSRWYDNRAVPQRVTDYRKKPNYKRFSNTELDPLQRYEFHKVTKSKFFFNRWFFEDDKDSEQGTLFESWISCHALQHESCFNCKARNSLRWYGGNTSSWQDFVCTACHSMYEVKSKATMEKVERTFKFNNISAGSFKRFCSLYNSPKRPNQKMFLVILPRSYTMNRRREAVHPVYVAEIDTAKPKLCESTFNSKQTSVSLKTNVSMKLHTKTRWFDLPRPEFVDIAAIKEKVFIDMFGRECWEVLAGNSSVPAEDLTGESSVEESPNEYDLQAELEKLQIQGNWDDDDSNSESE